MTEHIPDGACKAKFHIAVPVHGSRRTLTTRTLDSLLCQQSVKDGTADLTVDIIGMDVPSDDAELYINYAPGTVRFEVQRGVGQYGAVAQALRGSNADFLSYLGAGDTYDPHAFTVVREVSTLPVSEDVPDSFRWIVGRITSRREDGLAVRSLLPFRYRHEYFVTGLHCSILPTIQQESAFWSRDLNLRLDWDAISFWQLAGDFAIWLQLSRLVEPIIVDVELGSFWWHGDNRSGQFGIYAREVKRMSVEPKLGIRVKARLEKTLWMLPDRYKGKFSSQVVRYTWPSGPWV